MKTRIITALLILLCVIPPLLLGGWYIFALISFIIIAGGLELLALSEHHGKWPILLKPFVIACVFIISFIDEALALPIMGLCCICFLSIPVLTQYFHAKDAFLCISYIVFFFMLAKSFTHIYATNHLYVWMIIIATYVCDTAAYFSGRYLGRHKLNQRISPKKTWEGSIGGFLFGSFISFIFGYYLIPEASLVFIIIASICLSIVGQLGDLAFSAIKRCYKIKDFSDLLPGHGGVIDRVDSLVFNFICFDFLLVVFTL